jgi:hypothetical protein
VDRPVVLSVAGGLVVLDPLDVPVDDPVDDPGVVIAPFITFTTEVVRTTINSFRLGLEEVRKGRETKNANLTALGYRRFMGLAAAYAIPSAVGMFAAASAGMSGDDEEAVREFLPDWQKNNQIILLGQKGAKVSFLDMSFLDPHDYLKKPIKAMWRALGRGENVNTSGIADAVVAGVGQVMAPFSNEQIFAGALFNIARNTRADGRQVYNPQDTGTNIAEAIGAELGRPFLPGTALSLDRIRKAALGQTSDSGREYSLRNELQSFFAGQRISSVNLEQSLGFKASQFTRDIRDATTLVNREASTKGTRTPEEVIDAYQRASEARARVFSSLRDAYKASLMGLTPAQAAQRLRAGGAISQETVDAVVSGVLPPYVPTNLKDLTPERRAAVQKAIDAAKPIILP